jgi:acyl-coenzyme A synthetase/AMP-(fatty) acid ligase/thioesterase domain-containing protein
MTTTLDARAPDEATREDRIAASLQRLEEVSLQGGIIERFCEVAARRGENTAIDDGDRRLSYRQLRIAVFHLARRIRGRVPPGHLVGILLASEARFPVAVLACLAAGCPYVPLDCSYPAARNQELARDAGVQLIVTAAENLKTGLVDGMELLDIDSSLTALEDGDLELVHPQDPVAILYTSGSTGRPKGVCYDERAVLERVAHEVSSCRLGPDDRIFLISSASTIACLRAPLSALLTGATLCIANPQRGISATLEFFADKGITYGFAVPGVLRSLLVAMEARSAFRHARFIRVGGDVFRPADLELCRANLPPTCTIWVTLSSTESPAVFEWFVPPDWRPAAGGRIPVGYPRPQIDFEVMAENGEQGVSGEIGELVIHSPYLALGYWRGGVLESFEAAGSAGRTFPTGDLIRVRPDGLVEMIGRNDRQLKIRGFRVSPTEIEAVVQECAGVVDVAVIPRANGPDSRELVAYVVPHPEAKLSLPDDLRDLLTAELPEAMVPSQIRLINAIPRLPNGKQNHQELLRLDRQDRIMMDAGTLQAPAAPPQRPASAGPDRARIGNVIAKTWVAILGRRSLEADMPWDGAGGDSLGAMQLWLRIEEELKTRLPLTMFDIGMRPSQLLSAIDAALRSASQDGSRFDDLPLVFFMLPFDGDGPSLARFRAALSDKFRFHIIEYPSWREMAEYGAGFDLIADRAVKQIVAERSTDHVFIAGYSFGGFVAWEVGRRLAEAGIHVDFVGLIDSRFGAQVSAASMAGKARGVIRLTLSHPGQAAEILGIRVLRALIEMSAFTILRSASRLARLLSPRASFAFDWHLAGQVRLKSLQKWKLGAAQLPTALFCSDEVRDDCPDQGWREICEQLAVIPIGGDHLSILDPPHREILCERFAEAAMAAHRDEDTAGRRGNMLLQ